MDLISTSWSCQRCGAAFISTPPDHGLCSDCLILLESQLAAPSCPSCGGPVCAECGQRVVLFVPVPWPLAACPNLAGEVTSSDGG
jgi:hypothetical protein